MTVSSRGLAATVLRTEADVYAFCARQAQEAAAQLSPAVAASTASPEPSHVAIGLAISKAITQLCEGA